MMIIKSLNFGESWKKEEDIQSSTLEVSKFCRTQFLNAFDELQTL